MLVKENLFFFHLQTFLNLFAVLISKYCFLFSLLPVTVHTTSFVKQTHIVQMLMLHLH